MSEMKTRASFMAKANYRVTYRDHLIKADSRSVDWNGMGWWEVSIEEPGGRCVHSEMEIAANFEEAARFLSDLRVKVDGMEDRVEEIQKRINPERDQKW